jgi:hypothetical protein
MWITIAIIGLTVSALCQVLRIWNSSQSDDSERSKNYKPHK